VVAEPVCTDRLSTLARDIAAQPDGPASIARVVDLAPKVVGCSLVDVVHVGPSGKLSVIHSGDPGLSARLVRVAAASRDSLARLCCPASAPVIVTDLGTGDRCARYARDVVEATGLRWEMDIALEADDDWLVLRFFSETSEAWTDSDRGDATAFAELAALAIDRAVLRGTAQNLRIGLESNRLIGAAIGILMTRRQVTYEAAFALLRTFSQRRNRKLRSVAEDVVLTGDLPEYVGGEAA
jgi:GAF domain-containing protein